MLSGKKMPPILDENTADRQTGQVPGADLVDSEITVARGEIEVDPGLETMAENIDNPLAGAVIGTAAGIASQALEQGGEETAFTASRGSSSILIPSA